MIIDALAHNAYFVLLMTITVDGIILFIVMSIFHGQSIR